MEVLWPMVMALHILVGKYNVVGGFVIFIDPTHYYLESSTGFATDMDTHPTTSTSVAPFLGGPMDHVIIIEHPKPKSKLKHMNSLAITPSTSYWSSVKLQLT